MPTLKHLAGAALLAQVSLGCISHYTPPTAQEAHAILKIRRVYEVAAGTQLAEAAYLDEDQAFATSVGAEAATAARIDALLIHPRPALLKFGAGFSHQEMRMVQESYNVQTPYQASESYNCGSYGRYQTCSRTTTQYRSETRYRTVARSVAISDGSCASASPLYPVQGHTYLAELTYRGDGVCSLTCYEQLIKPDGSFTNVPCGAPLAPGR